MFLKKWEKGSKYTFTEFVTFTLLFTISGSLPIVLWKFLIPMQFCSHLLPLCYYYQIYYFLNVLGPRTKLYTFHFKKMSFKSVKKGAMHALTLPHVITHFDALCPPHVDLNGHLWSSTFSPKDFLYIFCKVGLLTTDSLGGFLVYFPIENSFILPSFLRAIFAGYKILGWLLFSLSGLWICPSTTLSLVPTVSSDRSPLTSLRFSVQFSHSSPAAFWDFFVFTTFFFFYYDVPRCGLLYVHATWSSLCFLNVEIVFSSNLGSFQQDFFSYFFLFPSLLSRNLNYMHFLELHGVPHFLRFCSFSSLFSIIWTT